MAIGLVGRKLGMTRVFTDDGASLPVTVIEVQPNRVTQLKGMDVDGYRAIQVAMGEVKASRVSKPEAGVFAKAGVAAGRGLREFRLGGEESAEIQGAEIQVGSELRVDLFSPGQKVDVTGVSKGKGFAGVIKRHHFSMQDATHGNSRSHRAPGSIGQRQDPGRVFKGKKMAGHLGAKQRSAQNLEVVRVDADRNLLLIKGAVPGWKGGEVVVRPAVKVKG